MLEDTFESMDDQEEMEEAAEMEIDKILFEITAGTTLRLILDLCFGDILHTLTELSNFSLNFITSIFNHFRSIQVISKNF